jgi:hypothetical protein
MPERAPPSFDLQSVRESMKWWGTQEVLFRAFLAERDGRRVLVRLWLEVYRQIVEEDRQIVEDAQSPDRVACDPGKQSKG